MSKKKSQFVLMATYFSDVGEDGTLETYEQDAPVLVGVYDKSDAAIEAITNLFASHERRLRDLFTDRATLVERLSHVVIYTPEMPKGVSVPFHGPKRHVAAKIEKALRGAIKKTVTTKKKAA